MLGSGGVRRRPGKGAGLMDDKTKKSLNRFLTEWMGQCWHEWERDREGRATICKKCKVTFQGSKNTYGFDWTSRSTFLDIWDKARESERWGKFIQFLWSEWVNYPHHNTFNERFVDLIAQPTFAEEWARFLGWKED